MAHFAKLDNNDIVTQVLVIEQDVVNTGMFGDPASFVQTSYNTKGGVHYDSNAGEPSADQSKALRKNFAAIGDKYDRVRDAFIAPQPFPSWALNEDTCQWNAPVAPPQDNKFYNWNEATLSWDPVVPVEA